MVIVSPNLGDVHTVASEIKELNISLIGDVVVKADVEQFVSSYKKLIALF